MLWFWKNDDFNPISSSSGDVGEFQGSSNFYGSDNRGNDRWATRKVVTLQCRREEAEPGKFNRRCEKTERILKDCVGRPNEMIQFNKEFTEDDVTDQMFRGSFAEHEPSFFLWLGNVAEANERGFYGGISQFYKAAEEMKTEFLYLVGAPLCEEFHKKHGKNTEGAPATKAHPKENPDGNLCAGYRCLK